MKKILILLLAVLILSFAFTGCEEVAQTVTEMTRDTWYAYEYNYTNDSVETELLCYFIYAPDGLPKGNALKADIPAGLSVVIVAATSGNGGAAGSLAEALGNDRYIYKTWAKGESVADAEEGDAASLASKFVVNDTLWTVFYSSVLKGKKWDLPPVALQKGTSNWEEITNLEDLKDVFSLKGLMRSVLIGYLTE